MRNGSSAGWLTILYHYLRTHHLKGEEVGSWLGRLLNALGTLPGVHSRDMWTFLNQRRDPGGVKKGLAPILDTRKASTNSKRKMGKISEIDVEVEWKS